MMEFIQDPIQTQYEIFEEIGSGQFATVKRLRHHKSQLEYAGKFIRKKSCKASRRGASSENIHLEVEILNQMDHENICKLVEVFEDKQHVVLVLELVCGGELFEYLAKRECVSEDEAVEFLKQILEGVQHLHEQHIVHLDLKPENLMLLCEDNTRLKIIDFGLSRKLCPESDYREMIGTPEFVAPEVINYDPLSLATDMWSIGVITYILLSGCSPFLGENKQDTLSNVSLVSYKFDPQYFTSTSDLAKDFIQSLLIREPKKRASVQDCLTHAWIQPVDELHACTRCASSTNVENPKSFLARKRWKLWFHIVCLCNRLRPPPSLYKGGAHDLSPVHHAQSFSQEDAEENFVLGALFAAVEAGNLPGLQELVSKADQLDINQCNRQGETLLHIAGGAGNMDVMHYLHDNGSDLRLLDKHGDSAMYSAARQGHLDVVKFLHDEGVAANLQNKAGETAVHVASRYGHLDIIEYLCTAGVDLNLQDKLGETALHTCAWHGLPGNVCVQLCAAGAQVDMPNKEEETALHCASSRGNMECVKVLLSHGASLNLQDRRGSTPLHLACRRRYMSIALLLLHAGCQMDICDYINESPLHPACKEGLLPIVQTMCAYGCQVDPINKGGVSPLHMAARQGHVEVVRCLLLSGAEPELPNKEGVTGEIMALAQGHNDIAELLARLKPDRREQCIKQLIPTNQTLTRIKVKLFGSSGVGKSILMDSLKCGYINSFFRKARLSSSASVTNVKQSQENGSIPRHQSLPTQLSYDIANEAYTRCIDVQQISISGVGDLSVWEFSGYEPYYMLYDHFIGDPNCVHIVAFSLQGAQDVQLSQTLFWLNFLKARMAPMEPIGQGGSQPWPAKVILVATHADKVSTVSKNSRGEMESADANLLLETMKQKFAGDLDLADSVFVCDAHLAMSPDLKALRAHLVELKSGIVQCLPCTNGFLDAAIASLVLWRKALCNYPVVTWPGFIEYVRSKVNMLASEEHLKELMCQLQLVGEVIYLETDLEQDLVILNPRWLCTDILGHLLSHETINHSRPTGCFTVDDFQLVFPETDAKELLVVLEAVEVCTSCEVDGEIEYEFPCLNFVETLHGLWERDIRRLPNPVYGGIRVQCPRGMTNQLLHLFPRIQVHLRRDILNEQQGSDVDLYQWYHGSKYCNRTMEGLISLEHNEQVIEVKVRGPNDMRSQLYYFLEDMCQVVVDVLEDSCPGLCPEKYILSPSQLKVHKQSLHAYSPKDILSVELEGGSCIQLDDDKAEEFSDLLAFGSDEIWSNVTPGVQLHMSYLSLHARRRIAMLLDPADPMGRDWCLLAVSLGLTEDLPRVDQDGSKVRSKTDTILDMWARSQTATIGNLLTKLRELNRQDAMDVLLTMSPLYHIAHNHPSADKNETQPESYSSENTLSSNLSR